MQTLLAARPSHGDYVMIHASRSRSPLRAGALFILLGCTLPAAHAGGTATPGAPPPAVAPAARPSMSMPQLIEHLGTLGYRDIKEIERKSDKLYEVTAHGAQGVWVELDVDARSGEVLRSEVDD
jgi:hypothetical protein